MSIQTTSRSKEEIKLATSPRRACEILDIGFDKLYELLKAGELKSYVDGGASKIDVASIHDYHQRKLEAAKEFRPRSPHGAR